MMTPDKIEDYIEKVYGYAVHHTYSSDEADELSQEILYTAIRELPKLRDDSRFEPWLWGVAANVTKSFRRTMGKYRAVYSFDVPEDIPFYDSDDYESEKMTLFAQRLQCCQRFTVMSSFFTIMTVFQRERFPIN